MEDIGTYYISTRYGKAHCDNIGEQKARLGFKDALMSGLARDGGLYLPEHYPTFSSGALRALRGKSYATIAKTVLWPFVAGSYEWAAFDELIDEAYHTFHHPAVAPLVQTGHNEFICELFHGPTLAFKDVAMQLLARLMDDVLKEREGRATIIGATSGDTGGAGIEAFAHRERCDIFVLFPEGRVSPFQRRQMTGNDASNVFALAIDGDFDDCQALVKAMFNDHAFRDDFCLSGINSINWARIMAQIVYYFTAALSLGAPDRALSFTVPTGNFGDIFAGFVASRMGLPIARLIIATNDNDILVRTLATGRYQKGRVVQTSSPSMDIQISSNFERLLFEASGRDGGVVNQAMEQLVGVQGGFDLSKEQHDYIKSLFAAGSSDMAQTQDMIKTLYQQTGYLADPHTGVGVRVARDMRDDNMPMVILSTAHPVKFSSAVEEAVGIRPRPPRWFGDIMTREEHVTMLPCDIEKVKQFIAAHVRVK